MFLTAVFDYIKKAVKRKGISPSPYPQGARHEVMVLNHAWESPGRALLNLRGKLLTIKPVKHWGRLPGEAVILKPIEVFKNILDKHLSGMAWKQLILP